MTTPKATITITLESDNTITTQTSHDLETGMAGVVWLGMLGSAQFSVMENIKTSQNNPPITCAKCGVDRMHEACKQPGPTCPLMGEAQ